LIQTTIAIVMIIVNILKCQYKCQQLIYILVTYRPFNRSTEALEQVSKVGGRCIYTNNANAKNRTFFRSTHTSTL
jgi:hypothetical protein